MTNWIIILYFIIGYILTWYWWNKQYEEEYNKAKANGDAEDSMAVIFMMVMIMFWPIKLVYKMIYKLLR